MNKVNNLLASAVINGMVAYSGAYGADTVKVVFPDGKVTPTSSFSSKKSLEKYLEAFVPKGSRIRSKIKIEKPNGTVIWVPPKTSKLGDNYVWQDRKRLNHALDVYVLKNKVDDKVTYFIQADDNYKKFKGIKVTEVKREGKTLIVPNKVDSKIIVPADNKTLRIVPKKKVELVKPKKVNKIDETNKGPVKEILMRPLEEEKKEVKVNKLDMKIVPLNNGGSKEVSKINSNYNGYVLSLNTNSVANYPSIYDPKTGILKTSSGFNPEENWNKLKFSKWSGVKVRARDVKYEILVNSLKVEENPYIISGEILSKAVASKSKLGTNIDLIKKGNLESIIGNKSCLSKNECSTLTKNEMKTSLYNLGVENAIADYLIDNAKKGNYSLLKLSNLVEEGGLTKFLKVGGYFVPLNTVNNSMTSGTGYKARFELDESILNNLDYKKVVDLGYNRTLKILNSKFKNTNSGNILTNMFSTIEDGFKGMVEKTKGTYNSLFGGNEK